MLRRRLLAAAAVLSCVFAAAARAQDAALSPDEARALESKLVRVAGEATPKTVMVQGVFGLGTGAVIDAEGTVVTNAHVAAGARYAIFLHPDGRRELARRKGIDYERDLAVLVPEKKPAAPVPFFELRSEAPALGDWVAALGYPGGPRGDARPTFTVGRVRVRPDTAGGPVIGPAGFLDYAGSLRSDAPIFFGNSGGPLVDMEGRLVGINGAFDMSKGTLDSLSIPTARVLERTAGLDGGAVRLPGGRMLDPRKSGWVRRLDGLLDPLVKQLMAQQLEAGRRTPEELKKMIEQAAALVPDGAPGADGAVEAVRRIVGLVAKQPRNRTLLGALRGVATRAIEVEDGSGGKGLATPVRGLGIVACASSFKPGVERLTTSEGTALAVVGRADAYDLLLLEPQGGVKISGIRPAEGDRPVGTLLLALGAEGGRAAGVLSAAPRPIPVDAAEKLARTQKSLGRRIVETVIELAQAVGAEDIVELGRQYLKSMELSEGLNAGSPPRAYASVISFDAPVGPDEAGAPLVDLDGRLVGVIVANAHFGTSYAVPVGALREAFSGPRAATAPQKAPSVGTKKRSF